MLHLAAGAHWQSAAERGVELLLCVEGSATLEGGSGAPIELARGGCALAPAAAGGYAVSGSGTLYKAGVGVAS